MTELNDKPENGEFKVHINFKNESLNRLKSKLSSILEFIDEKIVSNEKQFDEIKEHLDKNSARMIDIQEEIGEIPSDQLEEEEEFLSAEHRALMNENKEYLSEVRHLSSDFKNLELFRALTVFVFESMEEMFDYLDKKMDRKPEK